MAKVAGTAFVKIDGSQIALAGTLNVDPTNVEREGLTGLSGTVGYKENNMIPSIEMEVFVTEETNLNILKEAVDVTVTAELANGKVFSLRNAWLASRIVMNAAEGTATVKFEGLQMEEVGGVSA